MAGVESRWQDEGGPGGQTDRFRRRQEVGGGLGQEMRVKGVAVGGVRSWREWRRYGEVKK